MIGRTFLQYTVLEKLGEGGMGVVYRARDINLGRDVALKVLPEDALYDASARARFRKEALALARLNHPNIEAVYEFDSLDGVDILVTEYLPGATLAARLSRQNFPDPDVRQIGCQIAAALQAAHDKGVVHCDLKPANVMLTPEGQVKLLDFGLARILRPADLGTADATTLTQLVAGTVPYMAPEQLRGAPPDPRMDIYAAGVLLFELATGSRPFQDRQQASLIDAILHQPPEFPRTVQPAVSASLERIILRCLEKQPGHRYQSAADLGNDLERPGPVSLWSKVKARSRALTVSAVSSITAAIVVVWLAGSHPVLSFAPRDWILIADFENQTGDPLFDKSLLTAFTVSLEQSRVVNVFPRSRLRDTLRRMRKGADGSIDEALGEEVASREGIKALIVPSISGVGGEYRLAAKIREVSTGADVKSRIVRAGNKDRILGALDSLAAGVRKDLGESRLAVSFDTRPLQRVTTASLEALKQYSMGIEKHRMADYKEARLYYEQALKLDPQFTAARSSLGMLHFEHFDKKEGARLLGEALPDIDHLTNREKYGILAFHASAVEHDLEKAAGYEKARLALYPDDSAAHNNLGLLYKQLGRCQEAAVKLQEALRIDPNFQLSYNNLAHTYLFCLGDLDATINTCKLQLSKSEQQPWPFANLGWAYLGKAQLPEAERVFKRSAELFPRFFLNRYRLGMTYRFERRWAEALRTFEEILALDKDECYARYEIAVTRSLMKEDQTSRVEFARAQACLERILKADPQDAQGHMLLALVLTHLGRHTAAAESEQKGLSLNPKLAVEAAAVLAATRKDDEALARLELAVQKGYDNFVWIKTHPEFQHLLRNPRFSALLRAHLKGMGDWQ